MLAFAADAVGLLYALGGLVTAAFALRVAVNTGLYLRHRGDTTAPAPENARPRSVTVQIPIYNERTVAARAIDAACRLRWPAGALEIQVLDDSDDETCAIVAASVAAWSVRGVDVRVIRRDRRDGFKAGALQAGLTSAKGEAIAILDADFVPRPDFLERTVPHLGAGVAAVQARWSHLNPDATGLTRAQALALDGYFVVEQTARARSGLALNFNGSGGVWRRSAIDTAGGWRGDTLTEDVDLSFRAQLAGLRIVFLPDVEVPAELPETAMAFKRQQRRWARGTVQCALLLAGPIWRSGWPLPKRIHALASLTNHLVQPMLLAMLLGLPALLMLRPDFHPLVALLSITALNLPSQHAIAQRALWGHPAWIRRLAAYPLLAVVGVGMSLNGSIAVFGAFRGDGGGFERTPKRGDGGGPGSRSAGAGRSAPDHQALDDANRPASDRQTLGETYRLAPDRQALGEALLALFSWGVLFAAIPVGAWGVLPFAGTAAIGFTVIAAASSVEGSAGGDRAGRSSWPGVLPGTLGTSRSGVRRRRVRDAR